MAVLTEIVLTFPDFRPSDIELLEEMADLIDFDPDLRKRFDDFAIRVCRMYFSQR